MHLMEKLVGKGLPSDQFNYHTCVVPDLLESGRTNAVIDHSDVPSRSKCRRLRAARTKKLMWSHLHTHLASDAIVDIGSGDVAASVSGSFESENKVGRTQHHT